MLVLSAREQEREGKAREMECDFQSPASMFLNVWWLQLREEKQNNNKGEKGNGNV